jgi:hypothetical protein
MTGISRGANLAIAKKFPWKEYKSAVDVGTAQGDLIAQLALAHPHVAGFGFDLPEVGPTFQDYIENGLALRSSFVRVISSSSLSPEQWGAIRRSA